MNRALARTYTAKTTRRPTWGRFNSSAEQWGAIEAPYRGTAGGFVREDDEQPVTVDNTPTVDRVLDVAR